MTVISRCLSNFNLFELGICDARERKFNSGGYTDIGFSAGS